MSEPTPQLNVPREAAWGPTFDVARATDAYIATVPAAEREKSDAYFEGGYWIELWSTLVWSRSAGCCCTSGSRRACGTGPLRADGDRGRNR